MYAGQYRNNPILENRAKPSNLPKTREFKPKPNFTNSNTHFTSKRKDTSKTFSSIPLISWLFTNSTTKLTEQLEVLSKEETDAKAREIFHEASRTLEMANPEDLQSLGETMFQDMHECPEKDKEVARLKEVQEKLKKYVGVAAENRKKYNITGV